MISFSGIITNMAVSEAGDNREAIFAASPINPNKYEDMKVIFEALGMVFKTAVNRALFFILAPALFLLFFSIPVFSIPGNDFWFQAKLFGLRDYLLLTTLSILNATFLVMQIYIFRTARKTQLVNVGQAGVGSSFAAVASLFGSVTCASCVSALLGFLGSGTIFFLLDKRWYVFSLAILLLIVSIYFASRRIARNCESCK